MIPPKVTNDRAPGTAKGLFGLTSAADLLGKLESDLERLKREPTDSYAAFDFFVTAHHLPEWLYGSSGGDQLKTLRKTDKLLKLVRDIADGGKHLVLDRWPPEASAGTAVLESQYGLGVMGVGFYSRGILLIHLQEDAAREWGQSTLDVVGVARQVLARLRELVGSQADGPSALGR